MLEAEASFGGTWLIHKFPGIRSDSDLFTFGYKWKPWSGPPIATAAGASDVGSSSAAAASVAEGMGGAGAGSGVHAVWKASIAQANPAPMRAG